MSSSLPRAQKKLFETSGYGVMSLGKVDGKIALNNEYGIIRIYRQISIILHGVDQLHQISLWNPVPRVLDLPAESSSVEKTVWQLVGYSLQKALEDVFWVEIRAEDRKLPVRNVGLP